MVLCIFITVLKMYLAENPLSYPSSSYMRNYDKKDGCKHSLSALCPVSFHLFVGIRA